MRKLLTIKYSATAFNTATLLLRLVAGLLMMNHGYNKLVHFSEYQVKFMSILGIGSTATFALVVFAEFFCALFIIIGLFTRLATIPLIIAMSVALFNAHHGDIFGEGETAALFLVVYFSILLLGPGKVSVDNMTSK